MKGVTDVIKRALGLSHEAGPLPADIKAQAAEHDRVLRRAKKAVVVIQELRELEQTARQGR